MLIPITEVAVFIEAQEVFRKELRPGEYVIGREDGSDIVVNSKAVSRRHAKLTLRYSEWLIEDMGSSNGTKVGGVRIANATLIFPKQEVLAGNARIELRRCAMDFSSGQSLSPQTSAILQMLPDVLRDQRRYKVFAPIAMGGMGAILKAEDRALRRMVAMKVLLRPDLAEYVARFVEEAQITAQLSHPGIVPVYEINVNEQDNPYFTMKLIDGRSLRQVLDGLRAGNVDDVRTHPLESLLSAFRRVCDAIAFAHSKGVLHRDLKPDNVMIASFGEVVVMDWGLAKPIGSTINIVETMSHRTIVSSARMETPEFATSTDMSLGTPHYMSPEQAGGRGDEMDARTDVYSLGAMLFEILTLQAPVEGADVYEVMQNLMQGKLRDAEQAVREKTPAHLPNGKLPPELAAIAKKAMAFDRADRFSSVRELATAVGRWHPREAVNA